MTISADDFKTALRRWASGVTVVTSQANGHRHGMTVSAFSSVSSDPPLVLVCANRSSKTHEIIETGGVFAVNILAEDQADVSTTFASTSLENSRFDHVQWEDGRAGAPIISGAVASIECEVINAHVEGSHTIYIGRVNAVTTADKNPLLYFDGDYRALAENS